MLRIALATLVLLASLGVASPTVAEAPQYGLNVEILPLPDTADAYRFKAEVRDVTRDVVVAAPSLAFPGGEPVRSTTTLEATGETLSLTVEVKRDPRKAVYELEIRSASGSLVSRHGGTIGLGS